MLIGCAADLIFQTHTRLWLGKSDEPQNEQRNASEGSQEDAVTSVPQSLHDRWKGKPLRNLVTRSEALSELGTRKLCNFEPLFFGSFVCGVTARVSVLLADVHHVGVVNDGHLELCRMFLAHLLSLEGPVEIITGQGAFSSCHVATNDEMRGAEVFPNDHVLNRFARPSHFHRVGKVCPPEGVAGPLFVKRPFLHDFVSLDSCFAINVSWLRRAHGGMHEDDGVLDVFLGVQQKLEVRFVNWIAVLKSDNRLTCGQRFTHLRRSLESLAHATPDIVKTCHESMNLSTYVIPH